MEALDDGRWPSNSQIKTPELTKNQSKRHQEVLGLYIALNHARVSVENPGKGEATKPNSKAPYLVVNLDGKSSIHGR